MELTEPGRLPDITEMKTPDVFIFHRENDRGGSCIFQCLAESRHGRCKGVMYTQAAVAAMLKWKIAVIVFIAVGNKLAFILMVIGIMPVEEFKKTRSIMVRLSMVPVMPEKPRELYQFFRNSIIAAYLQ